MWTRILWLLCYHTCMQENHGDLEAIFSVDIKNTAIKRINSLYTVTSFNKLNAFNKFLSFFLVVVPNLNKIFIIMIKWTLFKCLIFNVCVVLRAIKLIFICKRNTEFLVLVQRRRKKTSSAWFNADNYIQLICRIIKT